MTEANTRTDDNATPQITPLHEHLRPISPARAAAVTRLLIAGERLLREDETGRLELHTDVAQQAPHTAAAVLAHAHGRIALALAGEHGTAAIGDRTWHDFAGEARLLAWTLAYEPLISRLSELIGTPLLPLALDAAPVDVWHWVGFRFERSSDGAHCHGLLGLDRAVTDALAAIPDWQRSGEESPRIPLERFPLPCRLMLPPVELPTAALRKLARGDVVVLGPRAAVLDALRLRADTGEPRADVRYAWAARASAGGITIARALSEAEARNETMTPEDYAIPSTVDDERDPRDAIPIRVELLLDELTLTLSELGEIGAGQMLSLRQPVENARVTLRANGKVFGSGELVALGDMLGLKVTRIGDARGLQ